MLKLILTKLKDIQNIQDSNRTELERIYKLLGIDEDRTDKTGSPKSDMTPTSVLDNLAFMVDKSIQNEARMFRSIVYLREHLFHESDDECAVSDDGMNRFKTVKYSEE